MTRPKLLAGDNPQIPKGYGEAPIRAFLDAVPDSGPGGWKHAACVAVDASISETVPGVMKAVKWNTPLYGMEEDRYFLGFHCFTKYVKVTFFSGTSLDPVPPEGSTQPNVRSLHICEGDEVGDQFAEWVRQAAALPGNKM